MCGICGIFGKHDRKVIAPMTESLFHRGPDDFGYFYHRNYVSLGQRRLSIIDLAGGRQPIYNEDKSIAVVFNGEIYNYLELRPELEKLGHVFATNTDTEVIVHLYEEYGEEFVHRMNGEWAIALFDSRTDTLLLYRDRYGVRSIYYARSEDRVVFASEVKALFHSGFVSPELDAESLNYFMTLRYVPGRGSLFAGISRLPPGHYMKLTRESIEEKRYYSLEYSENRQARHAALVEEFGELLEDSVRIRLRSDVPVGAFLSGGIDSSVIVALARRYAGEMNTYSIGFRTAIDENRDARELAASLGTSHHDLYVEENDFLEIESIIRRMDEPIGDFILLPTYLLNRRAATDVKVILTGEGADEILGGYLHHLILSRLWVAGGLFAGPLARGLSKGIDVMSPAFLNLFFPYPAFLGEAGKEKLTSLLRNLHAFLPSYLSFAGFFSSEERQEILHPMYFREIGFDHVVERCAIEREKRFSLNTLIDVDMNGWLPDYTLMKQDRLSMMNSIEGRVPYLDHRLVEFCARLPASMKNHGMTTKHVLREAAKSLLPKSAVSRKKAAFYIPTEKVFAPSYREFVMERLLDGRFARDEIMSRAALERLAAAYGTDEIVANKRLNNILILAIWYETLKTGAQVGGK